MNSCCWGIYVTVTTRDNGKGEFATLLEIRHIVFLLDDLLLEEPPKIEDDAERRRVKIDITLRVTLKGRENGNDRPDVGIQRLSLRDFLFRDEAEEGHEHAMDEKGGWV